MARESEAYVSFLVFLRKVMPRAVSFMLIWRPSVTADEVDRLVAAAGRPAMAA
jgi:hypothetical protein